ncbi:hypothetical protein [Mangrovimonas futianensis]|uniref:hypothetical protein n=1 Tax=Mangrovimonas futianensis TaxID=2895523 RepID=UPI001E4A4031|nr:hypothetical protein [Mangrovimonas futianensis]MCF1420254.1 hypothetical protein [Mangrovimonas futianensis]
MGINLYTTFYNESNSARRQELISCLLKNANNPQISSIVVFNEGNSLKSMMPSKLIEVSIDKRPLYDDFIGYINSEGSSDDFHMIANTDIFFDENIGVLNDLNWNNTCFALSRYDTTEGEKPLLYNHNDSQDVWVFKGSIKEGLKAPYPLGVPRCDNRFMYDLETAGYNVLNPAFSIKVFHMHEGQRAVVYQEADNIFRISPPYRYKYPHNVFGLFKTIQHNVLKKNKLGKYHYDIKKINNWIPVRLARKFIEVVLRRKFPLIGYKS